MEIVNQYGQLVGEFSRLDDELWLTSPDDFESLNVFTDGLQLDRLLSSHLHQHIAVPPMSISTDNPVIDGVVMSIENNSSPLKDCSQNQSQNLSPDSVLERRSFFVETNPVMKRARSKRRRSRKNFSCFRLSELLLIPKTCAASFVLEETTDSCPGKPVRTRKISDLLKIPNSHGRKTAQENPKKKDLERKLADSFETNHNCDQRAEEPGNMFRSVCRLRNGKRTSQWIPKRKRKMPRSGVKKCQHCGSSETPQWREGPTGSKTLCNACGVQYRNGRLYREYRPLRSPTYNPSIHSHMPKKVQETRLSKISEEDDHFSQHFSNDRLSSLMTK